jgi:hypothetical protein
MFVRAVSKQHNFAVSTKVVRIVSLAGHVTTSSRTILEFTYNTVVMQSDSEIILLYESIVHYQQLYDLGYRLLYCVTRPLCQPSLLMPWMDCVVFLLAEHRFNGMSRNRFCGYGRATGTSSWFRLQVSARWMVELDQRHDSVNA